MAKRNDNAAEPEEAGEELITVTLDGETIEIHPDAEADHLKLGWERV